MLRRNGWTAQVDALDERALESHLDTVVRESGRINVSFNIIGLDDIQGTPLVEPNYLSYWRFYSVLAASHALSGEKKQQAHLCLSCSWRLYPEIDRSLFEKVQIISPFYSLAREI